MGWIISQAADRNEFACLLAARLAFVRLVPRLKITEIDHAEHYAVALAREQFSDMPGTQARCVKIARRIDGKWAHPEHKYRAHDRLTARSGVGIRQRQR